MEKKSTQIAIKLILKKLKISRSKKLQLQKMNTTKQIITSYIKMGKKQKCKK